MFSNCFHFKQRVSILFVHLIWNHWLMKAEASWCFLLTQCSFPVKEARGAQKALMLLWNMPNWHLTAYLSLSCVVKLGFRAAGTLHVCVWRYWGGVRIKTDVFWFCFFWNISAFCPCFLFRKQNWPIFFFFSFYNYLLKQNIEALVLHIAYLEGGMCPFE